VTDGKQVLNLYLAMASRWVSMRQEISLRGDVQHLPVMDTVDCTGMERLKSFVNIHNARVARAITKPTNLSGDVSVDYVWEAFKTGNKDQVLLLLDYGIDVFSIYRGRTCDEGQERWVIDFYGTSSTAPHDVLVDQKVLILKEYRRHKWKIGLVGGSVVQFNRRRHFIAFLERYVINPKNTELREKMKGLLSIAIVQSCIASYM
jgi:hypothetical protein